MQVHSMEVKQTYQVWNGQGKEWITRLKLDSNNSQKSTAVDRLDIAGPGDRIT